ncbi:GT2 family glycosyltransferase [Promicromonospora sp. AC04]|uniref:glycosyltransferase n=1 Tax=Promicromonospora sp. AC04 TaxID=2135723 RepID=UPI000D3C7B71|nr:glycosyltransferase [Promicromonospora sp. AC04]PUB20820.1 GT2 family glycosyltransferase [Promicromonospora sp. AC04]
MRVSIVVAVRGNNDALKGLSQAIGAQDWPTTDLEVIVVDNHPTPVLPPAHNRPGQPTYRVVHERRAGLSRARNTGIAHANGQVILITDPDARPEPSWISRMVRALENTGAYCAGGRVEAHFTDDSTSTDVPPDVLQLFVPPTWPQTTTKLVAPYWVVGCNLAIRRDPPPRFDTHLGVTGNRHLSCEELELTVRAQQDGHLVVVVPDAVVHRAIHPTDLTPAAIRSRAYWHGVSVARLLAIHPDADIYDSYRLRDALTPARLRTRAGRTSAVADIARVLGLQAERLLLATARLTSKTTDEATKEKALHG